MKYGKKTTIFTAANCIFISAQKPAASENKISSGKIFLTRSSSGTEILQTRSASKYHAEKYGLTSDGVPSAEKIPRNKKNPFSRTNRRASSSSGRTSANVRSC